MLIEAADLVILLLFALVFAVLFRRRLVGSGGRVLLVRPHLVLHLLLELLHLLLNAVVVVNLVHDPFKYRGRNLRRLDVEFADFLHILCQENRGTVGQCMRIRRGQHDSGACAGWQRVWLDRGVAGSGEAVNLGDGLGMLGGRGLNTLGAVNPAAALDLGRRRNGREFRRLRLEKRCVNMLPLLSVEMPECGQVIQFQ